MSRVEEITKCHKWPMKNTNNGAAFTSMSGE